MVREYVRVRMEIHVEQVYTDADGPDPEDEAFATYGKVGFSGNAMNLQELYESIPQFVAESAVKGILELCPDISDDCEAGGLIRDFANELIPRGC